ncbi:MAG: sulfatase [Planctomycetaceae bacterium]
MPRLLKLLALLCCCASQLTATQARAADRPNVLWITSEDNGPQLGCYGDEYAVTPNIDALAAKSCRYLHCWSNAPVCAPARTTIITGMYPTSLGAEHMRSMVKLPEHIRLYPQYLRSIGYYCTNNSKTDYNVESVEQVWDDSSNRAHWKNRPEGTPFFAVFNHTISHESQIRNKIDDADRIHDPAKVRVPAYHPDTPEVRKDWAQYYDRITMMDKLVGKTLQELEQAELAEDTIVFYYGDHGSGMPRSKRMPYNSGLHVPLLVHIPEKWKVLATPDCVMGGTSDRLVSFVDLAPTLLSLCACEIPTHMQGHAFLGPQASEPQPYIYGFRGRMDERIDMMRSVTDGRYVYIRNFMPHRPYGQHVDYMFQTPTTRVWYEMWKKGELSDAQSAFWEPKPAEELYDLASDPDEVANLAARPEQQERLRTLRDACVGQMRSTRDLGVLPEAELHRLAAGKPPFSLGDQLATTAYPQGGKVGTHEGEREMSLHNFTTMILLRPQPADRERTNLAWITGTTPDPVATSLRRFWMLLPLLSAEARLDQPSLDAARGCLDDVSPSVRIVAAEALARHGDEDDLALALPVLLDYANARRMASTPPSPPSMRSTTSTARRLRSRTMWRSCRRKTLMPTADCRATATD